MFQVKGVIVSLDPAEAQATIKHEEIPGYMKAMTMPFVVKHTNELAALRPGDSVTFRMLVTDTDGWIEDIRKQAGVPVESPPPDTGMFRRVQDVEELNVGDPLPEYQFTNQLGHRITTAQFKGKALAINFLFTRCPFPTFCPWTANAFALAQEKLLSSQKAVTNWHLLTISFDPEFDTPAVLKSYAESHRYNPAWWTFATGALIDVTAIGEQFGLRFWREGSGTISHNMRAAVIDASGRVRKVFEGNQWTADDLTKELMLAAASGQPPK